MNPDAYREMAETEADHWWFTGRRSILSKIISDLGLPSHANILEIGSGTGGNLEMLSTFGHVSAIEMDESARSISIEKTGGDFDIRLGFCPSEIPFKDRTFDLICLFDVLEHIDADVDALCAVKKLMSKGGRILITVPSYRWLWSPHDNYLHHKRRYLASLLRHKALSVGLQPIKITYFNTILFPLAVIARLRDKLMRSSSASGTSIPPTPVNALFSRIFSLERHIIERFNLPYGVSLLAILQSEQY